jgi:DNA-binding NarL/FixJ family response regulator
MALERPDEARELAGDEVKRAQRWGAPRSVGIALRAQGLAEGGEAGIAALREAVSVLDGSGSELEHAHALVALGAALRRDSSRAEARELLQRGLEIAHRSGARPLAVRAQEELAATGARLRRLVTSGLDALTPSERRVAEMAAEGLTNKEIAQALFVTPKTVEVHLSSVYRKLEIASRAQLPGALEPPADAPPDPVPA